MKHVLITGVTGFVGKNLVRYFETNPAVKLYGFSRNPENARKIFEGSGIQIIDALSDRVFDSAGIDCIVHLAGIAHDLSGKFREEDYLNANVENTKTLYTEFLKSKASLFVFISSIKAVADHSDTVLTENVQESPSTPYGKSKLMAENFIRQNQVPGKETVILRPAMIHGPGNKGNLNLLYKFVRSGIPYPLGAFQNARSFLSISNYCWVMDQIFRRRLTAGTYHLADDHFFSTNQLVTLIGAVTGRRVALLRFPKWIIGVFATIGSLLHLPFNKSTLAKLTENMTVSNEKLLLTLGENLPVSAEEGLIRTIRSFYE